MLIKLILNKFDFIKLVLWSEFLEKKKLAFSAAFGSGTLLQVWLLNSLYDSVIQITKKLCFWVVEEFIFVWFRLGSLNDEMSVCHL